MDLVDKSNVQAVEKANKDRDKAIKDKDDAIKQAKIDIKIANVDANKKINEANCEKNKAIEQRDEANEKLQRATILYIGILGIVLLIISLKTKWFISDLIDCILIPFSFIKSSFLSYLSWITSSFIAWWEIALRIASALGIIALIIGIIALIRYLISTYKDEYDNRHLIIAVISFAVLCTFGDNIKMIININLILIYIIFQIIGMFVIKFYIDKDSNY